MSEMKKFVCILKWIKKDLSEQTGVFFAILKIGVCSFLGYVLLPGYVLFFWIGKILNSLISLMIGKNVKIDSLTLFFFIPLSKTLQVEHKICISKKKPLDIKILF